MTAQVIIHPALLKRLIEDKRREMASCEDWADSLYDGTRLAEEWNPALRDVYGGQDIAVEEAEIALADVRRELAALEAQAGGAA